MSRLVIEEIEPVEKILKSFRKKIVNELVNIPGLILAGSGAMHIAGRIRMYKPGDYDIFCLSDESYYEAYKVLDKIGHSNDSKFAVTFRHIQLIKRISSSIEEILSPFDIPCCQVAYDIYSDKLWSSIEATSSFYSGLIHFNPARINGSFYVQRLIKYYNRGFDVILPFVDEVRWKPKKEIADLLGISINMMYHWGLNFSSEKSLEFIPKKIYKSAIDSLILRIVYGYMITGSGINTLDEYSWTEKPNIITCDETIKKDNIYDHIIPTSISPVILPGSKDREEMLS